MGNVLDTSCRENENTHFIFNNFFRKLHRLWDNVEKFSGDRGATKDVTIWRTRVACWVSKATLTYSHAHAHAPGYPQARTDAHSCTHRPVSNTYCFPTATVIRERTSVLRYTHIIPLVFYTYNSVYQIARTEQKAPNYSHVHRTLQNCGSSVWILFRVTLLAPRI